MLSNLMRSREGSASERLSSVPHPSCLPDVRSGLFGRRPRLCQPDLVPQSSLALISSLTVHRKQHVMRYEHCCRNTGANTADS
jgi:hypothetical protein